MNDECKKFSELIEPYLRGELQSESAAKLRGHLDSCRACANELADLDRYFKSIRQLSNPPVAIDIATQVRKQIDSEAKIIPLSRRLRMPMKFLAAASVALIAWVMYDSWRPATMQSREPQIEFAKKIPERVAPSEQKPPASMSPPIQSQHSPKPSVNLATGSAIMAERAGKSISDAPDRDAPAPGTSREETKVRDINPARSPTPADETLSKSKMTEYRSPPQSAAREREPTNIVAIAKRHGAKIITDASSSDGAIVFDLPEVEAKKTISEIKKLSNAKVTRSKVSNGIVRITVKAE